MRKFTNNASSLVASGIAAIDGQVTIGAGEASLFPSPTGGDYAVCTLEDVSGNLEIVRMTARAGALCTITRAQEGTIARVFAAGSRFELRPTAGVLDGFLQKDGDSITGPIAMSGAGRLSGGGYDNGEIVNTPIRGNAGVTSNEFRVPPGGGPPTISGQAVYHVGNLTRAAVAAVMFPTGAVIMWYGTIPNIPTGWILCDGTSGTPDMRDKFVVGAGNTYALGATGGAVTKTTSSDSAGTLTIQGTALTEAQLPSHAHLVLINSGGIGPPTGSNSIFVSSTSGGDSEYSLDGGPGTPTVGLTSATGSGATHTHTASALPVHSHTVDVLPPYVGLYFIMKT